MDTHQSELEKAVVDAKMQKKLLGEEVAFNQELAGVLGSLQVIGGTMDQVGRFVEGGDWGMAVREVGEAERALGMIKGGEGVAVVGLMRE